jgi:hypothetical protein
MTVSTERLRATIIIEDREDGGIRIHSPSHPGLILSGLDRAAVMADVLPALEVIPARSPSPPEGTRKDSSYIPVASGGTTQTAKTRVAPVPSPAIAEADNTLLISWARLEADALQWPTDAQTEETQKLSGLLFSLADALEAAIRRTAQGGA